MTSTTAGNPARAGTGGRTVPTRGWVPLSASALVVGAMSLVLASLVNPATSGASSAETLTVVGQAGDRWLTMAVMFAFASFAFILGLPAVLTLFEGRGRRLGLAGAGVFVVGIVGTCGYAMLMVFFRALVRSDVLTPTVLDKVVKDRMLVIFLDSWVLGFFGGVLLLALALFRARTVPVWVPWLMLVFVVALPFNTQLGRVGSSIANMAFAAACTGMAMAAATLVQPTGRPREPLG